MIWFEHNPEFPYWFNVLANALVVCGIVTLCAIVYSLCLGVWRLIRR